MNPAPEPPALRGQPVPGNRWDQLAPPAHLTPTPGESDAPAISVVVPFYRDQAGLDLLLSALAAQDHPASRTQLIIADDGSPNPPQLSADLPFHTRVVRQEDRGFRASAARALGAAAAEGEVLAFLDGDMIPAPDYLTAAARLPALSPEAVVVGRRRHLDESLLGTGWRPGDPVPDSHILTEPEWLREAYAHTENLLHADSTGYRFVISAVLTMAREVYVDAGGFDPGFVGYGGEDWELAHRLWRAGGLLAHVPEAVCWHVGPDFAGREDPAEARRVKNRESMVLAPRISAPTARGSALGLTGHLSPVGGGIQGPTTARGPRVEVTVPLGEGSQAAGVLCVDAVLQAAPNAVVSVQNADAPGEPLPEPARSCLTDPRIRWDVRRPRTVHPDVLAGGSAGSVPLVTAAELARAADWTVDLQVPVRPAGSGVRPNPAEFSAWLLELEREGVDRVEVVDGAGGVGGPDGADRPELVATLTSSRARWRQARWGTADATLTRLIDLAELGWQTLRNEPDLEAWWGGWG